MQPKIQPGNTDHIGNQFERAHWFNQADFISRAEDGVIIERPTLPEETSETIRLMISDMLVDIAMTRFKAPQDIFQASNLLASRLRRKIRIGSIGCGAAHKEKLLSRQRWVQNITACDVNNESSETKKRNDGAVIYGTQGVSHEELRSKIFAGMPNRDLLFFGDSLHHTEDPYQYIKAATECAPTWIMISEPFHMDYDRITPETGYLMDSTEYLDSLLSESGHKTWMNWAILKGWKVAFVKMVTFPESSVMDDELERIIVTLERPRKNTPLPYEKPHDDPIWPISLLNDAEREAIAERLEINFDEINSLAELLNRFDLSDYNTLNPFKNELPKINEKMKDEELEERMAQAEEVFQIYHVLKRDFDIDLFERIYASSKGSFMPRRAWEFEEGADGFDQFAVKNYHEGARRLRKVLDPRKHAGVDQPTITQLIKDDLMKLRHPIKCSIHVLAVLMKLRGRKAVTSCFSGLSHMGRNHMLAGFLDQTKMAQEIVSLDINYESTEDSEGGRGITVRKIGGKDLSDEELMNKAFKALGHPDFMVMDDGLQQLPDPFKGVAMAYDNLAPGGILEVVSPFRFEEDKVTAQTIWEYYLTKYPESLLTLEDQEIWINWLRFNGGKIGYTSMIWGDETPDNLHRLTLFVEKPAEGETTLLPWTIDDSNVPEDFEAMKIWPYTGLKDKDKETVARVVGDMKGVPLTNVRGEIAYRLLRNKLEGEELEEFEADREGFLNGFLEGHDQIELLREFEKRFGIDEGLRQRFTNSSTIYATCLILKELYGIELEDYVERDLHWQEWKPWRFADHAKEYEKMYKQVEDSKIVQRMLRL